MNYIRRSLSQTLELISTINYSALRDLKIKSATAHSCKSTLMVKSCSENGVYFYIHIFIANRIVTRNFSNFDMMRYTSIKYTIVLQLGLDDERLIHWAQCRHIHTHHYIA